MGTRVAVPSLGLSFCAAAEEDARSRNAKASAARTVSSFLRITFSPWGMNSRETLFAVSRLRPCVSSEVRNVTHERAENFLDNDESAVYTTRVYSHSG